MSEWESMFSPKRGGRGKGDAKRNHGRSEVKEKNREISWGLCQLYFIVSFILFFFFSRPPPLHHPTSILFNLFLLRFSSVSCLFPYLFDFFFFLVSFFPLFPCSSLANPYHLTDKSKRIGWWQALVLPLSMPFSSSLAVAAGNSRKLQMHRRMKNEKTGFVVFFDGQGLKKTHDDNNNNTVVRFSFWTQVVARVMFTKGRRGKSFLFWIVSFLKLDM